MLTLIHDRYYRDSPESVQLSAYVARREPSRLSCTVAFKAGHAPEDAGDHSRPPQTLRLTFQGDAFEAWVASGTQSRIHEEAEALTELLEGSVTVAVSSRRWKEPELTVEAVSRSAVEMVIVANGGKPVMTLHWPLGVWDDLRQAWVELGKLPRLAGLVVEWPCPAYRTSLKGTARPLE